MTEKAKLEDVKFWTEKARKLALDAGLTDAAFDYDDGSGPKGEYTEEDVKEIIRTWA